MDLIPDVRRIIFKKLDLGSQYNLSLIWKDMAEELWRNVDVTQGRRRIDKLVDLEYAGVLASAGYIRQVDKLILSHEDASSIPANIINSLAKIVGIIHLQSVKGWRTSMLNEGQYKVLKIKGMNLDSGADKRPIKVMNDVWLENVTGDLEGLMERLTYGPIDQISRKSLLMKNMDISKVPGPLLNSFFKTFIIQIDLEKITGIYFQLMSGIICFSLDFKDIVFQEDPEGIGQNMNLDIKYINLANVSGNLFTVFENIQHCRSLHLNGIRSSLLTDFNMSEVLKYKVEGLCLGRTCIPDWLQQYDGDGICAWVEICVLVGSNSDVESYESWARKRGWTTVKKDRAYLFSRPE